MERQQCLNSLKLNLFSPSLCVAIDLWRTFSHSGGNIWKSKLALTVPLNTLHRYRYMLIMLSSIQPINTIQKFNSTKLEVRLLGLLVKFIAQQKYVYIYISKMQFHTLKNDAEGICSCSPPVSESWKLGSRPFSNHLETFSTFFWWTCSMKRFRLA